MSRTARPCVVASAALLALWGCSGAPEPAPSSPASRRAQALETLRALWTQGVDPDGAPVEDREVVSLDAWEVRYRTAEGEDASLRWADVDAVQGVADRDVPHRPVTLFVYLRPQSPSAESARDAQSPPVGSGAARSYVSLTRRPTDARPRFQAALDAVHRFAPGERPEPSPADAPAAEEPEAEDSADEEPDVALPTEEPDAAEEPDVAEVPDAEDPAEEPDVAVPTEEPAPAEEAPPADEAGRAAWVRARLERLKAWHADGLLDDEEYAAQKRQLLERW